MAEEHAEDRLADELRTFVRTAWDPGLPLREWWARLAGDGWAFPTWPEGLGGRGTRGATARALSAVLAQEGVIGPPRGVGQTMGGPTVLAHGSDAQRHRLVPPLAAGRESWCQLFSEPGAGSDLASLQTRAERDGDGWRITGQKVWSSNADTADRGLLLARTDPGVPKHQGITYFVVDMHQPGVEARPLRQMSGTAEFCEVFLDGARVDDGDVIGPLGAGWKIAFTTLGFERAGTAEGTTRGLVRLAAGAASGDLDRPVGEILAQRAQRAQRAGRPGPRGPRGYVLSPRYLMDEARRRGRADDPLVRQRLARFYTLVELNRLTGRRAQATARRTGGRPGPESSIGKIAISRIARESRELAWWLLGPDGTLAGPDAPGGGAAVQVALSSFAASLGGGTDEVQKTTIGERMLGLPKEPQADEGVPFRDLRVGTARRPGGEG